MSQALTIPPERTQTILRWVVCFAVVLLAHVVAVAKLLEHSDFADAPPGSEAVELDLALGDPQEQIDPIQYTPPKPVEQEVKPQQEPEQKEAEVALPKEVQPETPTPVEATPPQEEH
jgi:outer membrane biosynthesis protein TonB